MVGDPLSGQCQIDTFGLERQRLDDTEGTG